MLTRRVRQVLQSLWASAALQAFLFGSGILVARDLGPAGRGNLAIVFVLPSVATQVVCVGVPSAATYFISRRPAAWRQIVRELTLLAAVQTALAVVLLVPFDAFFLGDKGDSVVTAAILALGSSPLLITQYYGLHILQGLDDIRWFNVYRIAPTAMYTVLLGAALYFGLSVLACTALWLLSQLVTSAAMVAQLAVRARRSPANSEGAAPSRREIARFGVAGFLAQVSPVETFRVDSLLVAGLFSSQIVGYYAVATSVSNVPRFIADGIVAVGYPHVSQQQGAQGQATTKRYLVAAALLCGGSALGLALVLPWLIPLLFGARFEPSVDVAIVLIIAAGLISIRRVATDCLRALGYPAAATGNELVTWIVLAAGFLALGRWRAGQGVALSLAVAAGVGLLLITRRLFRPAHEPI